MRKPRPRFCRICAGPVPPRVWDCDGCKAACPLCRTCRRRKPASAPGSQQCADCATWTYESPAVYVPPVAVDPTREERTLALMARAEKGEPLS